jgi:hypothetical protein
MKAHLKKRRGVIRSQKWMFDEPTGEGPDFRGALLELHRAVEEFEG